MLEPLARSGAGRRLAWRRGDHMVHTPLLVARPASEALAAECLLLTGQEANPHPERASIRVGGGFMPTATNPPDGSDWARLDLATPQVIGSQLAMLQTPERALPLAEFATGDPAAQATGNTGNGVGGNGHKQQEPTMEHLKSAGQGPHADNANLHMSEEVAVAAGLAADAGDPRRFAARLVAAREAAGPARLLMAPGVGLVHHAALLVYAGVDLLDTLAVERATHAGWYLTSEGAHLAAELQSPLCGCTHCRETAPHEMDPQRLLAHNLGALQEEHTRIIGHLENDTLRALVETRARAHPGTAAALRQLDRHLDHFAARWPLANKNQVHATTQESLTRPDVARYRERLRTDYVPPAPADVLLLLPCSAKKPYARSQSHRVFRRVIGDLGAASRVHEVILTSPMGVVPRELEHTWPAAHYDVPVTGHWDREETHMIRHQLQALLAKGNYTAVVSHLDQATHDLIVDLLPPETPHTAKGHPTSIPARDQMRRALQQATRGQSAPNWPKRRRADAHAVLSWQLGHEAAAVLHDATNDVSGRPPGMRLYMERGNKRPLATFVSQRGLFAFTMNAARLLHEAGCALSVEIDDFTPRGTLFAVGVKHADPRIVPGDEAVLVHNGEVRGVGRAIMTGDEMTGFPRGAAVEVRHHG